MEPATALEASALLHELRVREVELEMQNEELRRSQEELGASRAKYFELFDRAPVGYVTLDHTGMIRDANLTAAALLGAERERLARKPLGTFICAADRDLLYRCHKLAADGEHQVCELRLAPAGEPRWIRLEETLIPGEGAEDTVFSIAMSDITAQKAAEEARTRIAAVVDSSDDAILTKTLEGEIVTWNAGAERLYGYAPEEVIGRPVSVLTPPDSDDQIAMLLGRVSRGTHVEHFETVRLRKDGTPVDVSLSISPIRDAAGTIIGAATIARDVSARHRAEEAFREVEQRYAALFANMLEGVAYCRMLYDEDGRPDDFVYLQVNPAFERLTGLADVVGKRFNELIPTAQADTPEVVETYGRVARSGEPAEFDIDFTPLDLSLHVTVFRPEPDHFVAAFADVSDRRRAEQAIRESEARLGDFAHSAADWLWETDADGVYTYSSEKGVDLFGLARGDVVGKTPFDFMPPEEAERVAPLFAALVARKAPIVDLENWNLGADGERFCLLTNAVPLLDEAGNLTGYRGADKDITERKQAEAALRDAHDRLDLAQRASGAGMWDWDVATGAIAWSAEMFTLFGIDPETVEAGFDAWNAAMHPDDLDAANARIATALADHAVLDSEYRIVKPDGSVRWIAALGQGVYGESGNAVRMSGLCMDITERKQAEEALRASDEQHRTLFESMAQGVVYQDAEGHITAANAAAERILGLTLAQMQGVTSTDPRWRTVREDGSDFPGEEHPAMVALRTGQLVEGVIFGVFNPADDAYHWINVSAVPRFRPGEQAPYQVSATFEDVTDIRAAGEALRESEARYRSLFEGLTEGVALHELVLDEQGSPLDYRILAVNPAFTAQTGMSAEAVCGKLASEAYGSGQAPFLEQYAGATLSGEPARFQEHFAPLGRDFDITAVRQSEGHFATLFKDVTERKLAEAEIRRLNEELEQRVLTRTAQLEAANKELEAFVYSAAHDLRAPLRAIDGFSQMVVEDAGEKLGAEDHEHLQRVRSAAQRMALLIDGMLALARVTRQEMLIEEVDVSTMAAEILADLAEAEPGRTVETTVASGLRAQADAALLRSIFANLLANAWKFTGKHESARIEVGVTDADGERAFYVRDDGAGFDPAYATHLFGAFQRMHEAGLFEGDGIGLATVQRLVARHGGRVWAEAEVEKGATFYFTLPGVTAAA